MRGSIEVRAARTKILEDAGHHVGFLGARLSEFQAPLTCLRGSTLTPPALYRPLIAWSGSS